MWFKEGRGTTQLSLSSGYYPGDNCGVFKSIFRTVVRFIATITSRRVFRNFHTMLRAESIKDCLPDRDPYDLQRAVNVYHSFRNETYKFIARKHGVVSFRFEHVEPIKPKRVPRTHVRREYKRNSLCAIFEYRNPIFEQAERKRRERLNNLIL